jgi:LysM repeat protein
MICQMRCFNGMKSIMGEVKWWHRKRLASTLKYGWVGFAAVALTGCSTPGAANITPSVEATRPLPTARATTTPRPTPTLAPATPPPPRESVITPTPIVYVVQSGDTLIPIANKFGVGVADVIAANGNLNPASLQIGQRLIIPVGATNPGASNVTDAQLLPSPTPLPYTIRGQQLIRTAAGSIEVLGEVFNPGPSSMTNVQIQVTLQDDAGTPLQAASVFVARGVIPPNQTSPFRVLFTAPPTGYSRFGIVPLRAEIADAATFAAVQIDKLQGVPNGIQFRVTGEAIPVDAISQLRLIVTAYDAEQRVIGYRYINASQQPLTANTPFPFDLSIVTASQNIGTFTLWAEGVR